MLVSYSDWKRPTDGDYAFRLRPAAPLRPEPGARSDIREVAARVLEEDSAARFRERVRRWTGPEDLDPSGQQPWAGEQHLFVEVPWRAALTLADVDHVLRGEVLVLRRAGGGQVDYVMRDHHTVDAVLYHYASTGQLPRGVFHADRHSDWCKDSYLTARVPHQAATWWALLEGLKRPGSDGGEPVLRERDVVFTTAQPPPGSGSPHRDIGASARIPGCVDPDSISWARALEREEELERCDWVSLDLDNFQPASQLRLTRGLLRDERFGRLMRNARVRLFVLSPQFTLGGDKIDPWTVQGSLHSSLRLLNLLRQP